MRERGLGGGNADGGGLGILRVGWRRCRCAYRVVNAVGVRVYLRRRRRSRRDDRIFRRNGFGGWNLISGFIYLCRCLIPFDLRLIKYSLLLTQYSSMEEAEHVLKTVFE